MRQNLPLSTDVQQRGIRARRLIKSAGIGLIYRTNEAKRGKASGHKVNLHGEMRSPYSIYG